MKEILFATGNKNKLREAREILQYDIEGTDVEIPEIQSADPIKVATQKALDYFAKVRKPIFVDDIIFTFNAFKAFPGTYINDFVDILGNEGMIDLLKGRKDRSAIAQMTLGFTTDGKKVHIFYGRILGTITRKPRGDNGWDWDRIFIPKGYNKTFAEMTAEQKNKISMRKIALKKFKKWLDKEYNKLI